MTHQNALTSRFLRTISAVCALVMFASGVAAQSTSLHELVRLRGQGKSELRGFGLVMGLPGTGDSAKDLVVARPLAKLLENEGVPIGSFDELAASRSIALVMVTAEIPETGARTDDQLDCYVSALHNPKSLAGGRLFIAPLRGPLPGQGVYAFASGPLVIEGANPNVGRVRRGAKMARDVMNPSIGGDGTITLYIEPNFASWTTSQLIANTINQHRIGYDDDAPAIARAQDERTVRVIIPQAERPNPANFIADILSIRFDPSLLDLPARIVVNERRGAIVVSGDAAISPALIAHGELVVTTVTPPREPTPDQPDVRTHAWTAIETNARPVETARLQDLLTAFRRLDVPVNDQIAILDMLRRSGKLHAEIIVD